MECARDFIPPHMHRAAVTLTHYELGANYGLRDGLQLSLRLPFDNKAVRMRYTTLGGEPYTPPYGDIHHRTETLSGISDPFVGVEWSPRDAWIFGAGTSIPAGHVGDDPVVLGRQGRRHEHIQFGSGTLMPGLSAQYSGHNMHARVETHLSLYDSSAGFRAPNTVMWTAGPSVRAGRVWLEPRLQGQYQSVARWNGETDEGSGFHNGGIRLQVALPAYRGVVIAPAVYRELYSRGLHDETFRQSVTWSISASRTF